MTREEAIKILADLTDNFFLHTLEEQYKALYMAVEALKAEPTGDLISRADALKPFCTAPDGTRIPEVDCDNFPVEFSVEFIKKHLLSLPSAEAVQGEWINREYCQVDEGAYEVATCSNCKSEITIEYPHDNYCPNCGARMKGGVE